MFLANSAPDNITRSRSAFKAYRRCPWAPDSLPSTMMKAQLSHIAITCSNLTACQAFWEKVFEAELIDRPVTGVSPTGAWYKLGDIELHLQYRTRPKVKTDQHFALIVEDTNEIADRARRMGRQVEESELLPGFCKRYFLYDPEGNRVEILQR